MNNLPNVPNYVLPQTEKPGIIYTADGPINSWNWNWNWFYYIIIIILVILIIILLCVLVYSYCGKEDECTPPSQKIAIQKGCKTHEYCLVKSTSPVPCEPGATYVTEY